MPLDYNRIKHWDFPEVAQTYGEKDSILYALGLGLGDQLPRLQPETDALTATARRLQTIATERLAIEHPIATGREIGW